MSLPAAPPTPALVVPALGLASFVSLLGALALGTLLAAALGLLVGPLCQAIAGTLFSGEARRRAIGWVVAGTSGAGVAGVPLLTAIDAALG